MTNLEKIKASNKFFLTPADVAPILGSDPQSIRLTARQQPDLLGFPFTFSGCHMKIPRIPFLRFIGEKIDDADHQASTAEGDNWEHIVTHTFQKEDGDIRWEITVNGWRRRP